MATGSAPKRSYIKDYSHIEPLPDPPPVNDMEQFLPLMTVAATFRYHFRNRAHVLIGGKGYLRRTAAADEHGVFPDCIVAMDVEDPRAIIARNGYVISEVGKPPDFVLEVASRSTGLIDCTVKREIYASFGVAEYWRFDYTGGRYHDAPLGGDELVNGEYRRLPIHRSKDGHRWGYSVALGLELCWVDGELRLRDPAAREFLPTMSELADQRDTARAERDIELAARDAELAARDAERAARDAELAARDAERAAHDAERAARLAAEAETARLREQLRKLQQG